MPSDREHGAEGAAGRFTAGGDMRLTIVLLGHTFDLSLEPTTEASEDDPLRDLGALGGTFVGFASHTTPEDIPLPQRTPAWDEPEE